MWRFLAGAVAGLLLVAAGLMLGRSMAEDRRPAIMASQGEGLAPALAFGDLPAPPQATELSREEKRFNRYDRDRNGAVSKVEYLANRQKAFARMDANHDGRLDFNEYAVKTSDKFNAADKDRSGVLNRNEFSTTRVIRKAAPRCHCSPAPAPVAPQPEPVEEGSEGGEG